MLYRCLNLAHLTLFLAALFVAREVVAEPMTSGDILQEMRNFQQMGSVLYVAAHPDDENNRLLPYLARGRALRTAYLSLTRGDGGQNLIGPELGAELGVIRTQELLAARRIDGAQQFFTRAKDFGFSKDSADTLKRWDRTQVLADIVRVIRTFRPDVMITRFSPVPGGTHGHHTASTILALEAFNMAGDPSAFPDQLTELRPWQPKRILWNSFVFTGNTPAPDSAATSLRLDAGGYDPLLGESFGEIGARGRTMHKSQGEGRPGVRGSGMETFQLLAGEPAEKDILDGVDTTWARIQGGEEIGALSAELVAKFDPFHPVASVPAVLAIRAKLAALPSDPLISEKRRELDRILQGCLGLFVESVIPRAEAVPGEKLQLRHTVVLRADFPVRWMGVRYPTLKTDSGGAAINLALNEPANREVALALPADAPCSQPYWLRADGTEGMFRVDEAALIGRPENPPVLPIEQIFDVGGQTLVLADEPVQVITDPVRGEIRRRLDVIPPVSLGWIQELELIAPGATKQVVVELTAARAGLQGTVQVDTPPGWKVEPVAQTFQFIAMHDRSRFTFAVTAPAGAGKAVLTASADVGGVRYSQSRTELHYDHIPAQMLQPPARLQMVRLDLAIRGRAIGYLPGAGDSVADCLQRMGYAVTQLSPSDLAGEKLRRFDAIVIGVRAFNTRADLDAQMPALFAYAEQGGNLIVQYNTSNGLLGTRLAPYALELSRDRITDATAAVTCLKPNHPVFTTPNKITAADFDGWVQERARFVPRTWDDHFVPLLSMADPSEKALTGTLLIAPHGKGYLVYTSLSWFRELPAGVPGAYRLFANLISLGK
jgi:LmbE family N-acetylglucosaminyl deacetylase